MTSTLHIVPGFGTHPDGDMLGLLPFTDSLKMVFDLQSYSAAWNEFTIQQAIGEWGEKNILICHSYGGAACKRELDKLDSLFHSFYFDLVLWLDPVPRFLWGQFRFWRWNQPTRIRKGISFCQENFPPTGYPFNPAPNYQNVDVSDWEHGLWHSDIPGSSSIQAAMIAEIHALLDPPKP